MIICRDFAEPENIKGNTITLYSDDAAHISRVLRGKTGDILTVCDGTGSDYIAEITDISDKSVILEIKETLDTKSEPSVKITLYQGLPKGDKMELIIQNAWNGAYIQLFRKYGKMYCKIDKTRKRKPTDGRK